MSSPSLALGVANARYWSTVAPLVRAQLAHWERRAREIPDPVLQRLACSKLRRERLNVEVAATLATLAPRAHRRSAVEAIVALQVIYDYLDLLTEQPSAGGLADGRRLFGALRDVLAADANGDGDYYRHHPHSDDGGYLAELVSTARSAFVQLPAAAAVAATAQRSVERCAEAQVLSHAAARSLSESGDPRPGDPEAGPFEEGRFEAGQLERWAGHEAAGTALQWPEFLAGAAASVIAVHALIATAADRHTEPAHAKAIDAVYLSIGALTMLDSLVDHQEDIDAGELGYLRYYEGPQQMARRLAGLAADARVHARLLPNAGHHLMTLVGVVAYYASAPSARSPVARPVIEHMRRELRPLIVPTLALMRAWRLAKRVRRAPRAGGSVACGEQ
jgi:tetraprenyl-beta-curcumene synthase